MVGEAGRRGDHAFGALIRDAVGRGRLVRIRARGGSMWPLVPDGSIVVVGKLERVRPGAVVVVETGIGFCIHRVRRTRPLIVQGDACAAPDPGPYRLLGEAVRVITPRGWTARLDTRQARWLGRSVAAARRLGHRVARAIRTRRSPERRR